MADDHLLPLALNLAEAWLLNARVRDNELDRDFRNMPDWLDHTDVERAPQFNPAELALKIIKAINADEPVVIELTLPEAWYLERRFRHTDPDAVARGFIKRIHALILQFEKPSLPKWMEEAIDACGTDPDTDQDTRKDTDEGTGALA